MYSTANPPLNKIQEAPNNSPPLIWAQKFGGVRGVKNRLFARLKKKLELSGLRWPPFFFYCEPNSEFCSEGLWKFQICEIYLLWTFLFFFILHRFHRIFTGSGKGVNNILLQKIDELWNEASINSIWLFKITNERKISNFKSSICDSFIE